jgi:Terminase large subunit, T4likevirus-type, N-terminal
MMDILRALDDPLVFAPFFRGPTWVAWRAFLAALFALPMTDEQLAVYRKHTGRTLPPASPHNEAWLVIGRRGGKSFVLATIAVFLACFRDWRPYLGPGELGTVMIIARDRRQARVIKRFITGMLHAVDMLKPQIEEESAETIALRNSVSIEIHTASFRSTRGYTIIAALLDEVAFWPVDDDAAEPDAEVVNAIRPGMATIPNAMLLCASSPYARRGALWDAHRRHFGKDGDDVLVWQADTRSMNAVVPQSFIDRHVAEDAARAAAEYGAVFRTDIEALVVPEAVQAVVARGTYERPPERGISYNAFVDPSGGSADSFALGIGHTSYANYPKQTVIIDCLREVRPPFSPELVTQEFAKVLKSYRVSKVIGDKFAGEWPREQFGKFGINYEQSAAPKSDLYRDLLPLINSGRILLLDNSKLINQLCGLERRVARGGRDSIDHAPGGHDDIANCVAGVAAINNRYGGYNQNWAEWVG